MQTLSDTDMDSVTGQSGITIVFKGDENATDPYALAIEVTLRGFAWGDTDGVGSDNAGGQGAGYLCVSGLNSDGTGVKDSKITVTIDHLAKMTLDVATTDSTPLKIGGEDVVPESTTFIKMGLPDMTLDVEMADQGKITLGTTPAGNDSNQLGRLSLTDMGVSLDFPNNSALYIFAH